MHSLEFCGLAIGGQAMRSIVRQAMRSAGIIAALLAVAPAHAQVPPFPAKPVRIVVPWPAGGGTDFAARMIGQKMSERMGQTFIVDNRAGAAGNIGADVVAKSAPDGYTMLLAITSVSINPALTPKMPFDIVKDFAPVTLVARSPMVLAVHPVLPVGNAKALVELARRRPGELNFAYSGAGTTMQVSAEMFNLTSSVKTVGVAYKGGAPAVADLAAGQVQFAFPTLPSVLPFIKSGRVRALAVTTAQRSAQLPDVATMIESGFKEFDFAEWYGLFVPAGVPADIVRRLNEEAVTVLRTQDVRDRFAVQGLEALSGTPEQFGELVRRDLARFGDVVRRAGIKVE
jgi:tripartite-type tricarboxylate transporter receptor subunit TctC